MGEEVDQAARLESLPTLILDPEAPPYRLRDLAADAARLSTRSVPRRLTSVASGSAGWSLR
jgi:hypothetical protein